MRNQNALVVGLFSLFLCSLASAQDFRADPIETSIAPILHRNAVRQVSGCLGCSDPSCGTEEASCGFPNTESFLQSMRGCSGASCAGAGCGCGDASSLSEILWGDCPPLGISIGGWAAAGFHTEGNGLFNSRPDEFALHQGWLYAERAASSESPFGFRVDVMYGIDADDTQAFGNTPGNWDFDNGFDHGAYGWAIPQAYFEVAMNDWTLKAGHFYTLIGYEVVTSPDNFFYSHAITMYNSEPFTHSGVVFSGPMGEHVEVYGGWTAGWDTGFQRVNGGSSWLGGASLTLTDDVTFTYISTAGNFGVRSAGLDGYSHSLVCDMSVSEKLNYVIQSDLLRVDGTGEDNIGINQYLIYSMNECLGLGMRMEWWKGDDINGYDFGGQSAAPVNSTSYYAFTGGINFRPTANTVVRPECRYDWSPALGYDQGYFGLDVVTTF